MAALYLCFIAIGLWFVVSAALGWEWVYALWDMAVVRAVFGEPAARWLCGACGACLVGAAVGHWFKLV